MTDQYKVVDCSHTNAPEDLAKILDEYDEKGYQVIQILESRGIQVVFKRRPGTGPSK